MTTLSNKIKKKKLRKNKEIKFDAILFKSIGQKGEKKMKSYFIYNYFYYFFIKIILL